ncbi:MAG: DUF4912 domain-containing protein [Verrucomicrobia bacterium]|jgi:hypothetical protein|nr:DUF4912 domain-containing protein [Verrucomicrobiota bacterium]
MKTTRASAKHKKTATTPRPTRARNATVKTQSATKPKRVRATTRRVTKKKPTLRRATVSIPTILLEGDHPAPPTASGPGEKFALGPTPPEQHFGSERAELPEGYGTKRLYLTARDPHWLYANWDLTREQQARYNMQSVDGHLILRIYAGAVSGGPISEIHVHPESRHWFANVERAAAKYAAEIGFYRRGRKWTSIATSGATLTPPETVSSETTAEFATIPVDLPFEQLLALVAQAVREHRPLAQAVEELRRAGHPELPRALAVPTAPWTPEQARALAEIVNLDQVRRVWIGSLEITELIRRQFERGISSLSLPTSPGGGVSSVSSPFGGEQPRGKGFWFNINAELIVYGATEPNASVTIGGRKIKLRPDGSFTYRFSLPDGQYDLFVVAVSADDTDGRAAELKVTRTTELLGDVGTHPQDPALKPPTPDSV